MVYLLVILLANCSSSTVYLLFENLENFRKKESLILYVGTLKKRPSSQTEASTERGDKTGCDWSSSIASVPNSVEPAESLFFDNGRVETSDIQR